MIAGNPDITLILPAYNEVKTIANTMCEVMDYFVQRGFRWELVVSADGTDGTRETARKVAGGNAAIQVIGTDSRRGKGRGIRDGVEAASGEIVGFADADNKVPIAEFDKMLAALKGGCEVAIGSRGLRASQIERHQPWFREWGGKAFRVVMRAAVGLPVITDTQCGFKFFQKDVAKDLFRRQRIDGYMFDVEVLVLASRLGYRIQEVPVRWHDDGDSRLNLFAGNLRNARDILKIRHMHRHLRAVAAPNESRSAVNTG